MGNLLAAIEKKGIPAVLESWDLDDLRRIASEAFRLSGVPECRQVYTDPDPGITDISEHAQEFIDALTVPRTEAEAASGIYTPPTPPRIMLTGTYDEIQSFFEGDLSRYPPTADQGPLAWLTDGIPIVPPTEDRVAKMLTGTSHSPDEVLIVPIRRKPPGPALGPKELMCTVEKVAINAVMAGCKPEYLPVVLAITTTSPPVNYPGDSSYGGMYVVSGPIAKEIGMNAFFCAMCPGNPANQSIGRAAVLVAINGGGVEIGLTCPNRTGNPNWATTFAEATTRSPWPGINEDEGYGADESVLLAGGGTGFIIPLNTGEVVMPGTLDELLVSTPQIVADSIEIARKTGQAFVMLTPDTAKRWRDDFGFTSIQQIQDWLWEHATWTVGEFKSWYWFYGRGPTVLENERGTRTMNPDHLDMPDSAEVPCFIGGPEHIKVIVSGGTGAGWAFGGWRWEVSSIDDWR